MSDWSYYLLETGAFTGDEYRGTAAAAIANTPAGCGVVPGRFDYLSQMMDLEAPYTPGADGSWAEPPVIDWQPDAPPDTVDETYAWDVATRRWLATPTLAANKRQRAAAVQLDIEAAEIGQARAEREALLAIVAGDPVPEAAAERLAAIEAEVLPLRATLQAIEAAATQAELDAIL